jgi:hypothetical protein
MLKPLFFSRSMFQLIPFDILETDRQPGGTSWWCDLFSGDPPFIIGSETRHLGCTLIQQEVDFWDSWGEGSKGTTSWRS